VTTQHRYPKQVFWSDDDGGFIAVAPDLPGSSAFGESEAQALAELDQAIEAWIEAARAAGNPVPRPSEPARQHSGKLLLRMPRSLHRDLANQAEREAVSLNSLIVFVLSQRSSAFANVSSTTTSGLAVNAALPAVSEIWPTFTVGTPSPQLQWVSGASNLFLYEQSSDWSFHLHDRLNQHVAIASAAIDRIFQLMEASTDSKTTIFDVKTMEERQPQHNNW
jgi:antitoxin HicB